MTVDVDAVDTAEAVISPPRMFTPDTDVVARAARLVNDPTDCALVFTAPVVSVPLFTDPTVFVCFCPTSVLHATELGAVVPDVTAPPATAPLTEVANADAVKTVSASGVEEDAGVLVGCCPDVAATAGLELATPSANSSDAIDALRVIFTFAPSVRD